MIILALLCLSVYVFIFNDILYVFLLFSFIQRVRVHISTQLYDNNCLHVPVLCSYYHIVHKTGKIEMLKVAQPLVSNRCYAPNF